MSQRSKYSYKTRFVAAKRQETLFAYSDIHVFPLLLSLLFFPDGQTKFSTLSGYFSLLVPPLAIFHHLWNTT